MTSDDALEAPGTGYRKGPVLLRRSQIPKTTSDQRLLSGDGDTSWLHDDPWRVMRIQSEFVEGFGALAEIGPAVSVFGSARVAVDHPDYEIGEAGAEGSSRPGMRSSRAAARASWPPRTRAPARPAACPSGSGSSCRSSRA